MRWFLLHATILNHTVSAAADTLIVGSRLILVLIP